MDQMVTIGVAAHSQAFPVLEIAACSNSIFTKLSSSDAEESAWKSRYRKCARRSRSRKRSSKIPGCTLLFYLMLYFSILERHQSKPIGYVKGLSFNRSSKIKGWSQVARVLCLLPGLCHFDGPEGNGESRRGSPHWHSTKQRQHKTRSLCKRKP